MKCKAILLLGILLAVSLVRADLASDLEALGEDMPFGWESIWKDNCQTRCTDGKCNTILGKTIWVNDSDGTCKPIEKAKSLKNGFYIEYLETDPSFNLTVSEFNISYMDMTLNFKGNPADYPTFCQVTDEFNAKCDFKMDMKWNEYDEEGNVTEKSQLKFQYKWELKQGVVIKGDKVKYEYKEHVMGKKFSFGGNSTTIQLQDADTENLEDVFIKEQTPDNNQNSNDYLKIGQSFGDLISLIKFNLSIVPLNQQIDASDLGLYVSINTYDAGEYANSTVYELANYSWKEDVVTWNNPPTGIGDYIAHNDAYTTENSVWLIWNVTSWVSSEYVNSKANISFYINASKYGGTDAIQMHSKEYTTDTTKRPYLNITYSEVRELVPPTYSDNSTNSTTAGADTLFSLKWTDTASGAAIPGLSNYIFSFHNGSNSTVCGGTLNCSAYSTENTCKNCSECNWAIIETDDTPRTCSGVWGESCVGNDGEVKSAYSWDCACGSYYSTTLWVDEVTVNVTTANIGDTIKISCDFDCHSTSSNNDLAISYYDGNSWNQEWKLDEECDNEVTYSVDVVVSGEIGEQRARCQIGYYAYDPVGTCFETNYADNDDVNFTVVGHVCSNDGSCDACPIGECDTNCSDAGCSVGTTEFINDTAVSFSGLINWSNVTKKVSSNIGDTIKWKVHASDTSDNWNNSETFSYVTTEAPPVDTCTCPVSGNWLIQCSDNCDIQACDMQTNNVLINGTGTAQSLRNITNAVRIRIQGGCVARW